MPNAFLPGLFFATPQRPEKRFCNKDLSLAIIHKRVKKKPVPCLLSCLTCRSASRTSQLHHHIHVVLCFAGRRWRPAGLREERPVVPGRHRQLRHRVRPQEHSRRLHQRGRLRGVDRGDHPDTKATETRQEKEELLIKKTTVWHLTEEEEEEEEEDEEEEERRKVTHD